MKKLFYILGIGLLMASCTEDFKDWADPQSNSENPASANAAVAAAGAIDFTTITADSVLLFTPTYNAEEGTTATNAVVLYNADKSDSRTVNVDDQGRAKTSELRDALEGLYGIPEDAVNVPITVTTVLNNNGQAFRFVSNIEDAVKMAAGMYIVQGNDKTPMEFVEPGKFTLTVPAQEMEFFFLPFTDLNNFEAGKLGSTEETDGFIFGGKLAKGDAAHVIWLDVDTDYTQYIITVNTNDMTYDVEGLAYADMIWQAGNANGWGSPAAGLKNKGWKEARNNDGDYFGFMYLNGDFKFRSGKDNWNAPDWGLDEAFDDYSGALLTQSQTNLSAPAGFYRVEANLANMTYKLTPITTIGVIGGFNGWASDYASLQYNPATGAWEGYCDIPAGTEFKFRANEDWAINWGGDINNLSYDGGNLMLDVDGYYFIQLYITYEGDFRAKFSQVMN
ncbi:MAG: DUF5115 domain-containing protein [Muribaculaceae bacterium]|nr:DUF5115 domain-containing protein [Muribaculaceae bacterium]